MKINELIKELCPNGVEWKTLGEVAEMQRGTSLTKANSVEGDYPVISGGREPAFYCNQYNRDGETITIAGSGAGAGFVQYWNQKIFVNDAFSIKGNENLSTRYLYYCLQNLQEQIYATKKGGDVPHVHISDVKDFQIPLPPLAIQTRIVSILDHFTNLTANLTAELNLRRKQFEHYREKLLSLDGVEGVEWKKLGEVAENLDSKRKPITSSNRVSGDIPYYGASGIVDYVDGFIFDGDYLLISEDGANLLSRNTPIAFSISGKTWVNNHAHILYFEKTYCRKFVEYYINRIDLTPFISDGAQPKLNQANLNKIPIPYPSEDTQHSIVSILDKFTALIENIEKELALRQKQYEYYREELLRFGG